jgi:hypothetical protein
MRRAVKKVRGRHSTLGILVRLFPRSGARSLRALGFSGSVVRQEAIRRGLKEAVIEAESGEAVGSNREGFGGAIGAM